jgi:hypothetical protein
VEEHVDRAARDHVVRGQGRIDCWLQALVSVSGGTW